MYIRVYMIHETADMVDSSLGLYVIMMSKTADYAGYSLDSRRFEWNIQRRLGRQSIWSECNVRNAQNAV